MVSEAIGVLEAVGAIVCRIAEVRHSWAEWRTRQNPVHFWLAVAGALGLLAVALLFAHDAWQEGSDALARMP